MKPHQPSALQKFCSWKKAGLALGFVLAFCPSLHAQINGTVTVSGSGNSYPYTGFVGDANGDGTLNVEDGASASGTTLIIGSANGNGTVLVTGVNVDGTASSLSYTTIDFGDVTETSIGGLNGGDGFNNNTGTLTIADGAVASVGTFNFYGGTSSNGIINLNSGGMLETASINGSSEGASYLNFNGGIVQVTTVTRDSNDIITNFATGSVTLGANGGTIDTQGYTVFLNSTVTGTGGLTKIGSGTLDLIPQAYTGGTTISGGTLVLNSTIATSGFDLTASGTTLDVSGDSSTNIVLGDLAGVSGSTVKLGAVNISAGSSNSTEFDGDIQGTGTITIQGTSNLTLGGTSTLTGGNLRINAGQLTVANGGTVSGLTTARIGLTAGQSGSLTVTGTGSSFSATTISIVTVSTAIGSLTVSDGGTVSDSTATVSAATGTSTIMATVTGSGSTWTNSTSLVVSQAGHGTLDVEDAAVVSAPTVTLGRFGVVDLASGGMLATRQLAMNVNYTTGTVTFDGGILQASANSTDFISGFVAGDITVDSNTDPTLSGGTIDSNGHAITDNAVMGGTGGLTKAGTGTLTLTAANTYTGITTVKAGELDLDNPSGNAVAGDVSVTGGTAKWLADNQVAATGSITMTSGTVDLNGHSQSVTDFTNSGGSFTTGTGHLTGTGNSVTWSGGTNTVNTGGEVEDSHVVITGGTNTVQEGGTLKVDSGGTGLEMTGSTLTLNSDATTPGTLLLDGDLTTHASATSSVIASGGSAASPGVADLGGGIRIFTVENGAAASDLTIDAVLTDGGVTKEGTGTLTLSAANNYTGATTIAQGRLQLGTANAINSASALNLTGGTLDLNGFTPTSFTQTLTIAGLGASIDFGFGHLTGVTLQFADSSAVSWTSDLNLLDFSPGTDLLNFGSATGLTDAQLTDILLPDFTATGLDRSGNVLFTADTPATAPEPSVLALLIPVLALLVVVGLWRRRAATTS